ncbi:hypothetical protein [Kingella oralis]
MTGLPKCRRAADAPSVARYAKISGRLKSCKQGSLRGEAEWQSQNKRS